MLRIVIETGKYYSEMLLHGDKTNAYRVEMDGNRVTIHFCMVRIHFYPVHSHFRAVRIELLRGYYPFLQGAD